MSERELPVADPSSAPAGPRWPYLLLAWLCLALALLGVILPGLPTTPFVLLAGWAAARGSRRLHRWLHQHALFGAILRDWERSGAVSRRAKWSATLLMLLAAALMLWSTGGGWPAWLGCALMAAVAVWLWRRPEPG